jgi:GNAT superfamily N-acetyltransferase
MGGIFGRGQRADAEPFSITVDPAPRREDIRVVEEGLNGHAVATAGIAPPKDVAIFVRDEGGRIVAGLTGVDWGGNLHIRLLWVHEDYRGEGYGRRLVHAAELEAAARGLRQMTVSTVSYQAPDFYESCGFERFAVLEDVPVGHSKHYFRKHVAPIAEARSSEPRG